MSMLAERKRKQKWSLNPRGKEWSQDANKFGQKLMEKMGWQNGKGLGANENGITEHIKISYKNDSKGMGYKESNDQWTEHETNYSALLESLTGKENGNEEKEEKKVISLEQKSQASRSRVHYHKFTRGKDLSRYSEKDLANIFGRKSLKEVKEAEIIIKKDSDKNSKESADDNKFLVNAGSMKDYFKMKLSNFGKVNGYVIGNNGVLQRQNSESETESRPTFGFGFSTDDSSPKTPKINQNFELESETRPTFAVGFSTAENVSKTSKNKTSFVSYVSETSSSKRVAEESHDIVFSPKKKSKKEKQKTEENFIGISNPAFNPMATPVKIQKHVLNTIEESLTEEIDESINTSSSKNANYKTGMPNNLEEIAEGSKIDAEKSPKKKKNHNIEEFGNTLFNEEIEASIERATTQEISYEVSTKKLKNKKKKTHVLEHMEESTNKKNRKKDKSIELAIDNSNFDSTEDISTNVLETEENPYEVKVKKKYKKLKKLEVTNQNFNNTDENSINISQIDKKTDKSLELAIDNANFDSTEDISTIVSQIEENPYEIRVKKKNKKSKKLEANNPNFNDTDENSINISQTDKKKDKSMDLAIDNPNFDSTEDIYTNSQIEENPYEVKVRKKNKKSKKLEVDNPNFDDTEDNSMDMSQVDENPYEVKRSEKKKKKKYKKLALDNPSFEDQSEKPIDSINPYEVKSKKKKRNNIEDTGIANPALNLDDSKNEESTILEDCDLMLNIISTPVPNEERSVGSVHSVSKVESVKSRKSVRFSHVTHEVIIPNNAELKEMYGKKEKSKKRIKGLDNANFDKQKTNLDENIDTIAKTLDNYQAEIENDINEEKMKAVTVEDLMVGEVGNPDGENEKLEDGTKLKFKYAGLDTKTPFYMLDKVGAKKSYKHLIKGDILVKFKNANLHEIKGYATRNTNKV